MRIMDRREIEFDMKSVIKAITVSPKAAQGFGLPAMAPAAIRFNPREGKVDVLYGAANAPRAVSLPAAALGALLVSYCIRVRIPMPKLSDKGIRLENQSVILAFRTKFEEDLPPAVAETASRAAESVTAWTWLAPDRVPADPSRQRP